MFVLVVTAHEGLMFAHTDAAFGLLVDFELLKRVCNALSRVVAFVDNQVEYSVLIKALRRVVMIPRPEEVLHT